MKLETEAKHQPWRFCLWLFCIALLPRVVSALAFSHEAVWDGHYYHFGAQRIAEGWGYSESVVVDGVSIWKPWTHYPVGYSAWLSIFYRIFGSGPIVAPLVNALTGAVSAVLVFLIARCSLAHRRAQIAGLLVALNPGLIIYSALVMTEMTAAFFLLLTLWAALNTRGFWLRSLFCGLSLAAAVYVRPASLVLLPGLFLLFGRPYLRSALQSVAIFLVCASAIFPWSYRNCQVMDECAIVSTNGGWNLAIGALTTTGRFRSLHAADGCPIVTGQVQQDRCWAHVGIDAIFAEPIAWLKKMPLKLGQTFNHESFAVEYLHEASPGQWPESRRKDARQFLTHIHWLVLVAACLSSIRLWPSTRRGQFVQLILLAGVGYLSLFAFEDSSHPFYLLVLLTPCLALLPLPGRPIQGPSGRACQWLIFATALTHAVFFGDDRYHLVLSPFLCLLAAGALRQNDFYSAKMTVLSRSFPNPIKSLFSKVNG